MRTGWGTRTLSRLRTPLVAVVAVVLLASLMVGVRQVTVQLRGDGGGGGDGGDRSSTAVAGGTDARGPAGDASGDGSAPSGEVGAGELQTAAGEPAPAEVTVGPVVADGEFAFTPTPDRVAVVAGAKAARAAAQLPDTQAPADGSSTGTPSGPGTLDGPAGAGLPDLPADAAPDEFTMLASVETDGYRAKVRVGLGGGLDGGLAALTIDFGDGTDPFALSDDRIAALGSRGQVSVTHTYQPTLTLQPQAAAVVATDGTGQTHVRTLRFETRAAYRLSYSPLTVTAEEDCDPFGKGDFELIWQNDSSLPPGKTSRFDLGKNESYVEREFPTTVVPVYYGEFPPLFQLDGNPAFFYLELFEYDGFGGNLLQFFLAFPYEFNGPAAPPDFLRRGPVAQLGNHQYGVTLRRHTDGNQCDARMEFTVALTML